MAAERLIRVAWGSGVKFETEPGYCCQNEDPIRVEVLATAGDVTRTRTPVYQQMADVGYLEQNITSWDDDDDEINRGRTKVLVADGVLVHEGSVSFDCDNETLPTLLDWFLERRKRRFSVTLGTQELEYVKLTDCHWSQLTLNGGAQGLVNGSVSFVSNTDELERKTWNPSVVNSNERVFNPLHERTLVPYWQTGNNDVVSWSFGVQQAVLARFTNTRSEFPRYFRVGPWEITIQVETLVRYHDPTSPGANELRLCLQRLFKPVRGFRLTEGVTRGGVNEPARYTYSQVLHGEPEDYTDDASKQGLGTAFEVVKT